jgi:fibronectin-binding autotransporter adhesin
MPIPFAIIESGCDATVTKRYGRIASRPRPFAGWLLAALGSLAMAVSPTDAFAQITWAGTSAGWDVGANWSPNTSLVNGGTYGLVFAGSPTTVSSSNSLTNLTLGLSGTAIRFDAAGFTLSGNAITLGGNISNFVASGTNTISLGMTASGARTITGTGGSTLVLGGPIVGSGSLTFNRTAGGVGTASFTLSGSNDFTGGVSFQANTAVRIENVNAFGRSVATNQITFLGTTVTNAAGAIVTANNVVMNSGGSSVSFNLGGGSLEFTGTTNFPSATGMTVSSGTLILKTLSGAGSGGQLGGAGTIVIKEASSYTGNWRSSSGAGWVLIGDAAALGTGTYTLNNANGMQLGTTKDLTITTRIATALGGRLGGDFTLTVDQPITGAGGLTKVGTGTLALTANNTFAGTLASGAGIVRLSGSNALAGVTLNGLSGTLAGVSFENPNSLGVSGFLSYAGITGGTATMRNSSASPVTLASTGAFTTNNLGTLAFEGPSALTISASTWFFQMPTINVVSSTLTLAGSGTGAGIWTKTGAGTLRLTGSNSFNGAMQVADGVVLLDGTSALPGGTGPNRSVGVVRVYGQGSGQSPVLGLTSGTFAVPLNRAANSGGIAFRDAAGNAGGSGGFAGFASGSTVYVALTVGGTTGAALTFGQTDFLISGSTLILGAPNATGTVDFQNSLNLNGAEQTVQADDGSAAVDGILSGTLSNGSLTKTGLGTLALTAANTYSGTTRVLAGALRLANNLALQNSPLDTSGGGRIELAVTTPTFAGLSGTTDLATEVSSGYDGLASLTLNVGSGITQTYSGAIADGAAGMTLTKTGEGTQVLSGANTYTGLTTVSAGTLQLGVGSSLSGNISNSASLVLLQGGSTTGVVNGVISGTGLLAVAGSGTVRLANAANTYTAQTWIQSGVAEATVLANTGVASSLGTPTTDGNARIDLGVGTSVGGLRYVGTGDSTNRPIFLAGSSGGGGILDASGSGPVSFLGGVTGNAGTTLTLAGSNTGDNYITAITGSNVTKTGAGTWVFGTNSFTGRLSIEQGTIVATGDAPGGSGTSSSLGKQNGPIPVIGLANGSGTAALLAANGVTISRVIEVATLGSGDQEVVLGGSGAGTATFDGNSAFRLGRGVTLAADAGGNVRFLTPTANWQQQNGSADPAVAVTIGTPTGTGTVTLETTLPNSLTAVNVRQGTLRLGNGTTVGALGPASTLTGSAGATLAFDRSDTITSGVHFANSIGGAMSVRQQGSGTVVLAGVNTYTGATDVVAGTLEVDGVLGNTAVMVALGATLTGTGTIGGPTTILGTHSPGSSPGIETFTSGLTYGTTSTLIWELIANTESPASRGVLFDGVDLTGGALSILNGATLSLVFNLPGSTVDWDDAFWGSNRVWTIIDVAGGSWDSSLFTLQVGVDSTNSSLASKRPDGSFQVVDQGGDLVLEYVVVPEPGTLALAAIGLAAAAWAGRMRRRPT